MQLKNGVVKKSEENAKIKSVKDKIPDITAKTTLNTKINKVKARIPSIISLPTTTALTGVENKIPKSVIQSKKVTIAQKLMKMKRKLLVIVMINTSLLQNLMS